jgi:hypothetical protein
MPKPKLKTNTIIVGSDPNAEPGSDVKAQAIVIIDAAVKQWAAQDKVSTWEVIKALHHARYVLSLPKTQVEAEFKRSLIQEFGDRRESYASKLLKVAFSDQTVDGEQIKKWIENGIGYTEAYAEITPNKSKNVLESMSEEERTKYFEEQEREQTEGPKEGPKEAPAPKKTPNKMPRTEGEPPNKVVGWVAQIKGAPELWNHLIEIMLESKEMSNVRILYTLKMWMKTLSKVQQRNLLGEILQDPDYQPMIISFIKDNPQMF